ncbi:alpha/beta fold hydrolase [Mycolicibacterium palauense]|uniref:alpha/beta fold hydrolase n=1 Tax=Mycolicibacterium palauense TaxID=2034511 RepID=UPI000BFEBD3A|nr:alpha/beta hydrolase [Mycolicibacterium palauense]
MARTTITVDGLRTHYLELGRGAPVVLLHAGDFGASAETSWHEVIEPLAQSGYRVIAPDWLGFGGSDKVVDFADPHGRRLAHMRATVAALELGTPAMIGFSMGGTLLARALARPDPLLPASLAVLAHGGGFAPLNAARQALQDYDLTPAGMAKMLRTALYSDRWSSDEEYVAWRHRLSLEPGAWAAVAAARVRPPGQESVDFGTADNTVYERIRVPTLVVAGENDPLREPGYAAELAERIPDSELLVYPECGHGAPLEQGPRFVKDVVSFLNRRYRGRF